MKTRMTVLAAAVLTVFATGRTGYSYEKPGPCGGAWRADASDNGRECEKRGQQGSIQAPCGAAPSEPMGELGQTYQRLKDAGTAPTKQLQMEKQVEVILKKLQFKNQPLGAGKSGLHAVRAFKGKGECVEIRYFSVFYSFDKDRYRSFEGGIQLATGCGEETITELIRFDRVEQLMERTRNLKDLEKIAEDLQKKYPGSTVKGSQPAEESPYCGNNGPCRGPL